MWKAAVCIVLESIGEGVCVAGVGDELACAHNSVTSCGLGLGSCQTAAMHPNLSVVHLQGYDVDSVDIHITLFCSWVGYWPSQDIIQQLCGVFWVGTVKWRKTMAHLIGTRAQRLWESLSVIPPNHFHVPSLAYLSQSIIFLNKICLIYI